MYIKEIELNNFRIYKGTNHIDISTTNDKNIVVISGNNGFGKTTFLMSLVWCLYGKQMQKVDQLYQKEIVDQGGYPKYIAGSLNRLAKVNGETKFSVSVTFKDVKTPKGNFDEVKIVRSYDTITSIGEKIEVLIDNDNQKNELIEDLSSNEKQEGEEIFIREFILPIEIAKFFFFDAEKIVSLAEINSLDQRRLLSKAYTEVLGIKKYEDLKDQLEGIQDEYRKRSAKPKEKIELNEITTNIKNLEINVEALEQKIQSLKDEKDEKERDSKDIQVKLIKEGNFMTLEELRGLKKQKETLTTEIEKLQDDLKDMFDYIPFGLAGENLMLVNQQQLNERNHRDYKYVQENVEEKIKKVLDDLEAEKKTFPNVIPTDIRHFYEKQIVALVKKHFFNDIPEIPSNFELLHDFNDAQNKELAILLSKLQHSLKDSFVARHREYSKLESNVDLISRKIRTAEKDAENDYISDLRDKKENNDYRIRSINIEVDNIREKIGGHKNQIKTYKQRQQKLRHKIDSARRYSKHDKKIQGIISKLKSFIKSFKEEKKKSLENNILTELNNLLRKKSFIQDVTVAINQSGDDVDINLYNHRIEKIDKGSLSMGERQMYATALLRALVDESDIEFPVFIDSPLQKFDRNHSKNIIQKFYPNISKQVVLFPILFKELTTDEYKLLEEKVIKTYIIHNYGNDESKFLSTKPDNLIKKYEQLYAN